MLRNLPEGSRYYAAVAVDRTEDDEQETVTDPRMEALMDHRTWTLDRRLKAMEINAININTSATGQWGPNGPPEFPTVGPADWQTSSKGGSQGEPVYTDNFDFFRKIGAPVG